MVARESFLNLTQAMTYETAAVPTGNVQLFFSLTLSAMM